ncbi:MAG: hypothetical protein AABN95_23540 [Acidobacteriota bacterium]
MAEERTLGIARARETWDEEPSKDELQRRMDEARDSITNTVTEIKENVAQQVETVKDALDWREHFKRSPVTWSLGAAGVGFFVGYGIAAAIKGDDDSSGSYVSQTSDSYAHSLTGEPLRTPSTKTNGHDEGPGMLERFKETSAYERLSKEAGTIGDRIVEELSTTAQAVVLPFLLNKIKNWVGLDLSEKPASMGSTQPPRSVSSASSVEGLREV